MTTLTAAAEGSLDTYAVLCAVHGDGARRLVRGLVEGRGHPELGDAEVDDLVARACAELWSDVAGGVVAAEAIRPHLLAAVRAVADPGSSPPPAVLSAFGSLSPVEQMALWRTEVEDRGWDDAEPAARARAALPGALVAAHAGDVRRVVCRETRALLPAYVAADLAPSEATRVGAHLDCCRGCTALYLELAEAHADLSGFLASAFLGTGAAAYLAGGPARPEPPGLVDAVVTSRPVKSLAALAVVAAVLLGVVALWPSGGGTPDRGPVGARPPGSSPQPDRPGAGGAGSAGTTTPAAAATADSTSSGAGTGGSGGSGGSGGDTSGTSLIQPTQPPTQPVTQQVTPVVSLTPAVDPTAVDMAVRVSRTGLTVAQVISIEVTGLADDQSGTVTLSSDQLVASLQADPRCTLLGVGSATCTITGPSTLSVTAVALPLTPTTLTVAVSPAGDLHDTSTVDNSTSIPLDGRV